MAEGVIRLHAADNVVIALQDLPAGAKVEHVAAPLPGPVPRGHKIALRALAEGEQVIRYGQIIGQASAPIAAGAHVHSHNLGMGPHSSDYAIGSECQPLPPLPPRSFMGYHRADGSVGTRNYLGILTSVNCSGSVARFIAEAAEKDPEILATPGLDGIVPIVHSTGCGMSGVNEGYDTLMRTLKGYARNPNFGGILLVGLGCEVMQVPDLVGQGRLRPDGNFRYMSIQGEGGTRKQEGQQRPQPGPPTEAAAQRPEPGGLEGQRQQHEVGRMARVEQRLHQPNGPFRRTMARLSTAAKLTQAR